MATFLTAARRTVPSKQIRLKGPKWKASPAIIELLQQGKDIHKHWIRNYWNLHLQVFDCRIVYVHILCLVAVVIE
jgi:hypothetical protein